MKSPARRTALYPGTFDPVTNGHVDLVRRAVRLFDRVIVAVADSPRKGPLLSLDQRVALVREVLADSKRIEVRPFTGLLVEEYRRLDIHVVLKGLRSVADFEYEFQQAQANRRLHAQFETMFFMPSDRNTCISSSLVREIHGLGGDVRDFVPAIVARTMAGIDRGGKTRRPRAKGKR
jgi:pantetheine-phosphate adenylyltransferase